MIIIIKFHHETSSTRHVKMFQGVPDRVISATTRKSKYMAHARGRSKSHEKVGVSRDGSATKTRSRRHDDERDLRSSSGQICNMIHVRVYIRCHVHSHKAHILTRPSGRKYKGATAI